VGESGSVRAIVLMGVSGSGKSTVGRLLAERLRAEFCDADSLHPPRNIERMTAGRPLRDIDRRPWLHAVGRVVASGGATGRAQIVACSALKRAHRDIIRSHAPGMFFVHLHGPHDVIEARIASRNHEFMPPSLLASQFQILEPLQADEGGMTVDVRRSPADLVDDIRRAVGCDGGGALADFPATAPRPVGAGPAAER
jgi:gluconokinase